ncbi:MAG: hypothetical protein ACYCW6_23490 [Candidatus Xenobia bacterium]
MRALRSPAFFLALSVVLLLQPLAAQPPTLLQQVRTHIETLENYAMMVYLQADGNEFVLQYRCTQHQQIRVEVLDGPMCGTVACFSGRDPQHVKVHFGDGATCTYSTSKLQGTPIVESVLDMLAGEIQHNQVSVKSVQQVSLDVGRPIELISLQHEETVPRLDDGALGRSESVSGAPAPRRLIARRTVQHNCTVLEGHLNAIRQELYLDSSTLDPVEVKVYRGKHLEGLAEVWDLQTARPTAALP